MSIHHKVGSQLVEFASHVKITTANQALTVNGTAFDIARSSTITNINTNISNIDRRVTNIENSGTVTFDQNTMTLTIGGTSYTVSDGSSLASAILGKRLVQVAHKNVQSNNAYEYCSYTTQAAGWYKFCTSYNNIGGDMWNTNTLWSGICYGLYGGGNDSSCLVSGWGSYWIYSLFLPAYFPVTLLAFKGTSETSTSSGRRTIYMYQ